MILTFVSSQTGINEHMRYVLPIFPFFFIWIGRVRPCLLAFNQSFRKNRRMIAGLLSLASLLWIVSSSLYYYPHSLSYFNELIGGPRNGWKHLANSNIDWGQDLLFLRKWVESHPEAKPLQIVCPLAIWPDLAWIDSTEVVNRVDSQPVINENEYTSRWYAASITLLCERREGPGRDKLEKTNALALRKCAYILRTFHLQI